MEFYEDLGMFYARYEEYVRETEMNGKKPVSILSYVVGKF